MRIRRNDLQRLLQFILVRCRVREDVSKIHKGVIEHVLLTCHSRLIRERAGSARNKGQRTRDRHDVGEKRVERSVADLSRLHLHGAQAWNSELSDGIAEAEQQETRAQTFAYVTPARTLHEKRP